MDVRRPIGVYGAWIVGSAWLCAGGWVLSWLGQLNRGGYAVFLLSGLGAWYVSGGGGLRGAGRFRAGVKATKRRVWRWRQRFRRLLPMAFLLLASLAALGGMLYEPNNGDGLTYRVPRVLHWLAAGRWHWIDTVYTRMNYSSVGFEWLMAPLLLFRGGDRLVFLINMASYLMLPGLAFLALRGLGVGGGVAWHWMWLLASGYCFVLQAGSIGNDAFAAVYLLGSLHFALRARKSGQARDLWLSVLAAALLSGTKASNVPLLLPYVIVVWPALRLARGRIAATCGVMMLAVLASQGPIAVANRCYSGSWSGDAGNATGLRAGSAVGGVTGNVLQLVTQSLCPPILPWAKQCSVVLSRGLPEGMSKMLARDFPRFRLALGEMPMEEDAGLGVALTLLVLGSAVMAAVMRVEGMRTASERRGRLAAWGGAVAALAFMANMASESTARLLAAYYPMLMVLVLLMRGQREVVRNRMWKGVAVAAAWSAVGLVILTPARPLWPAQTVLSVLAVRYPGHGLIERARSVYGAYARKWDSLGELRELLPADVRAVGFVGNGDESEVSLWRPIGQRRVVHLSEEGGETAIREQGLEWAVVSEGGVRRLGYVSVEGWLRRHDAEVVARRSLMPKVSAGPQQWFVVRMRVRETGGVEDDAIVRGILERGI